MYEDEIARGKIERPELEIAGRVRAGGKARYILCEEESQPVQVHYRKELGGLVPHFDKRDCPHCPHVTEAPKNMWYFGALTITGDPVILELPVACYKTAASAARKIAGGPQELNLFGDPIGEPTFIGLLVEIRRANFTSSPRVLRCEQRVKVPRPWPYNTRRELARIWNVPIRPRLWKEA